MTGALKTVHPCNFRTAGRLSNENARSLTSMHDSLAHEVASVLDLYLSTPVEVKFLTIDQLTLKEYLEHTPFYVVPLSLGVLSGYVMLECDSTLVLSVIELLMGGVGQHSQEQSELSEIDEEVMRDVVQIIAGEAEKAWRVPGLSIAVNERIKPTMMHRFCVTTEKLTLMKFGVRFGDASGLFTFVLPSSFVMSLLKIIKLDQPQKKTVWQFPKVPIRDRMLDCQIEVAAELPGLKVAVHDLVALQRGSVLKLRAPIQAPGMLTAGGRSMFEAMPVRNGSQRAAQLGRRIPQIAGKREETNG